MSRGKSFWLRFFAANWYATIICLLILGVAANALIYHQQAKWGDMSAIFAIFAFFIGLSWYRWNARLAKMAGTATSQAGTLSLDSDGIRTILASGASTFVPWSSYSKWTEGKNVFLLTGKDGAAILPIDESSRNSIRAFLADKISQ